MNMRRSTKRRCLRSRQEEERVQIFIPAPVIRGKHAIEQTRSEAKSSLSPGGGRWDHRHGSHAIQDGQLKAETDTDYLRFCCPTCGEVLRGGVGIRLDGMLLDDNFTGVLVPLALSFRLGCLFCGFSDFFKIAVDNRERYSEWKPTNPLHWPSGELKSDQRKRSKAKRRHSAKKVFNKRNGSEEADES